MPRSFVPSMDPSLRFQQTLPYLLLPVSPSLAAIHASRGRRQLADALPQDPSLCPACGYYLPMHSRISRSSKSKKTRVFQRTCVACQKVQVTRLDRWTGPETASEAVESTPQPIITPTVPIKRPEAAPAAAKKPEAVVTPKVSRPKKKTGLQAMLSRNREQEKERKNNTKPDGGGGLSAFLSNL
ncbi:hypothetical protein BKA70DRAFT_1510468 [Coprinopsis sp. MPI-PUGE-AT-0042]|nr:hypothetical protein BKA70DRAFT_1510468 [Coprinopsis sp. MPI-PUGE-AT-0042]